MPTIKLQAILENLDLMVRFIEDAALKHGLDEMNLFQLHYAAAEALVNVIKYAYPVEKTGSVEISCDDNEKNNIAVKIVDWGVPFNPVTEEQPDLEALVSREDIGGYGIYMIREIVDEIHYSRDHHQNVLTLVKHQPQRIMQPESNISDTIEDVTPEAEIQ